VQFTANWDVPARLHKLCASGAAAQALQQASAAQQAAVAAVEPQQAAVAEQQDEDADDAEGAGDAINTAAIRADAGDDHATPGHKDQSRTANPKLN
jgi:hypothetical protein